MLPTSPKTRLLGATYAISDTGPLISVFQSDSLYLLGKVFAEIHLPSACATELDEHGWDAELHAAENQLAVIELTANEKDKAVTVAEKIAQHPNSGSPVAAAHIGEAQAIVLASRSEYRGDLLLLDEMAARAVAQEAGLKISGFPGTLLLATQLGFLSAEELKLRLESCRRQGTRYRTSLIQSVYEIAKKDR